MGQSNIIAGFLMLAFVVFITIRGELPIYMGLLLTDPKGSGAVPQPATNATNTVADKNAAQDKKNMQTFGNAVEIGAKVFGAF